MKSRKEIENASLKELELEIDKICMGVGLTVSELFKNVSFAAASLPAMNLHSDMIDVNFDGDTIVVSISGLGDGKKDSCDDDADDADDIDDFDDDDFDGWDEDYDDVDDSDDCDYCCDDCDCGDYDSGGGDEDFEEEDEYGY